MEADEMISHHKQKSHNYVTTPHSSKSFYCRVPISWTLNLTFLSGPADSVSATAHLVSCFLAVQHWTCLQCFSIQVNTQKIDLSKSKEKFLKYIPVKYNMKYNALTLTNNVVSKETHLENTWEYMLSKTFTSKMLSYKTGLLTLLSQITLASLLVLLSRCFRFCYAQQEPV